MRQVICLLITALVTSSSLFAQFSISGPECVTTQTTYQYLITGNIDSSTSTQVCVRGGRFVNSLNNCINLDSVEIRITWNAGIENGNISISSSNEIDSLHVSITPSLNGGLIDSANISQVTDIDSLPKSINCSPATNGSCDPVYTYQWELSDNRLAWQDIANENNQNLVFGTVVTAPTYYRRKVMETNSGTIKYSSVASVYIIPKPSN